MTKTAKAQSARSRARRVQRELFIPSFQSSPAESGFRLMPQHSILPFFHHSTLPTFLLHIQENLTGFANLVGFTTILHSSNLSLPNRRIATFFPPIAIGVPSFPPLVISGSFFTNKSPISWCIAAKHKYQKNHQNIFIKTFVQTKKNVH